MKKTILNIAKTSKTFAEFVNRIYNIPECIIDDDDEFTVVYFARNGREYEYNVWEFIKNLT